MATFPYPHSVPSNYLCAKELVAKCTKALCDMWLKCLLKSHKVNVLFIDYSKHSVTKSLKPFYCCCGEGISLEIVAI